MPHFRALKKLCVYRFAMIVAFQLLGLFLQRSRRLLWMMLTYLQPVYPEISEESSDARWTLCQTHLDFCLSFLFPPTQSPCTVAGECSWKPAIFPNTEGGGVEDALTANHCSNICRKLQKTQMKESPCGMYHITENVSDLSCLPGRVWHEDGPILIWIQTRFSPFIATFPPARRNHNRLCHKSCL